MADHSATSSSHDYYGNRVCANPKTPGEPCYENKECEFNICESGSCSAGKPVGESCTDDSECESKKCVDLCVKKSVGEACTTPFECETDICSNNVCSTPKAGGESCNNGEECQTGVCEYGECKDPKNNGERCNSPKECQSGVCEYSNVYWDIVCTGKPNGASCTSNARYILCTGSSTNDYAGTSCTRVAAHAGAAATATISARSSAYNACHP